MLGFRVVFIGCPGYLSDQSQLSYIAYSFSFFSRIFSLLALFSISALSFTFSLVCILLCFVVACFVAVSLLLRALFSPSGLTNGVCGRR